MSTQLVRALVALAPTSLLLVGAVIRTRKENSAVSFLQLAGAACLVVVALTHVSEALGLFSAMRWGQEDSLGHYFDLASAILGFTLFPLGYLLDARK